jgi:hypothetical protein
LPTLRKFQPYRLQYFIFFENGKEMKKFGGVARIIKNTAKREEEIY